MAELEAAWSAFLYRVERVWYKTLSHMKANPRFLGWKGKYEALRKADELLLYLKQARGAEEHTIVEVVGVEFRDSPMGQLGIRGADGSVVPLWDFPEMRAFLEKAGLTDKAVVHAEAGEKATYRADFARLNIIHNRGGAYLPPKRHLGQDLKANDPITVAEFGLEFYRTFVTDVEAGFP